MGNPVWQIEDWLSAIAFVKSLELINAGKIALWGTSYSGGHVLVAASRTEGISAIVSQVPFVDQLDFIFQKSIKYLIRFILSAIRVIVGRMVFEKPFYIPVVGKPDSFAILNTPECYDGYMGFIPKGTVWDNKITPGGLLWPYRPIRVVRKISCPVLIVCAKNDSLASERVIRRTANRVKKCELIIRPINHFEIYSGKPFEEIIRIEAEFLCRSLL